MEFLLLVTLIASIVNLSLQDGNLPPFCGICGCKVKDSTNYEVTCTRNVKDYLFNTFYYFDNKTNSSWPIKQLSIHENLLIKLDEKFPKSDLKLLDLSNNSIINIGNNVFSNLENMETLILSDNNIEILNTDTFKGLYQEGDFMPLRSLKVLRLDYNKIHSLNGNLFAHISHLKVLSLSHNPIEKIDHQTTIALTSLPYLIELDLSYTGIRVLPDYILHTPKFLKNLDLSGNSFDGVPKQLADAHSLELLYLSNNPIVNLTKENGFPKIATLKTLHMCEMPDLRYVGPHSLSNLVNLSELYLGDNGQLSHIDQNALSDRFDAVYETWPPIKKLYLANNKLTRLDMNLILKWEGLSELDLTGNPWTCECENQWIVDELMPVYLKIDDYKAKSMRCAAPIEMEEFTFYDVYVKESNMRCLDYYGNHPERDGPLLVGLLAGLLLMIPTVLFIFFAYQRHWFGLFDNSPAAFSRQFYHKTSNNDDVL